MDPVPEKDEPISIPRDSFTAFRLMYAPADEVSKLSQCVFLGPVPDLWWGGEQMGLFASLSHWCKSSVKRNFNSTTQLVNAALRLYEQSSPEHVSQPLSEDSQFQTLYNNVADSKLSSVYRNVLEDSDFEDDSTSLKSLNLYQMDTPVSCCDKRERITPRTSTSKQPLVPNIAVNSTLLPSKSHSPSLRSGDSSLFNTVPALTHSTSSIGNNTKVRFESTSNKPSPHDSYISFTLPTPRKQEEIDDTEYARVEHDFIRKINQIHYLASKSKKKASRSRQLVKKKVTVNFLKNYKAGDILRIDKMLVTINNEGIAEQPGTNSNDVTTKDRMRDYDVLLRKGSKSEYPLVVQLYDVSRRGDFSGRPDHSLNIQRETTVHLYSSVEKSFRIIDPRKGGRIVYIMIPRYSSACFMWISLVQSILGDIFVPIITVKVGGTDISTSFTIPKDIIIGKSVVDKMLNLYPLQKGYRVQYDELLDFLLTNIRERFNQLRQKHTEIAEWMSRGEDPWFCFKFFDRLEWVPNDSRTFLIQNHIQRINAQLEIRQKTRTAMSITTPEGKTVVRPHAIEGFLSRITNTSGEKISNLRAFFKIQYFHTAKNVLFFGKLFSAVPPSPKNALMDTELTRENMPRMPEVFLRNPFEVDEDGHIHWLASEKFDEYDREAAEEFSRRVQQVLKADAAVDLCSVREVSPIRPEEISNQILFLQSFLWHASTTLIKDENLMDCGFQILLLNGSSLKLLAPSRFIRDQWVARLGKLVEYWRGRRTCTLLSQLEVRRSNMEKFGIQEHVDSNATSELQGFFSQSSLANDALFTIGTLSMPTSLVHSGYVYHKFRKHSDFSQRFLVLSPGYLLIFNLFKRSKVTGVWKRTPCYEHYMTLPLSSCYVYGGELTLQDLVDKNDIHGPGQDQLARFYPDGWKSSEEDTERCFTIWYGKKRKLRYATGKDALGNKGKKNPRFLTMVRKSGMTGKKMVFMCRSRQERGVVILSIASAIATEIRSFSAAQACFTDC
ncbi:hypothetical protein E0198_000076 [Clavispora lusitaniae]|nr:hypothetical protein E0198_000076 [Clavispora lusitaniae]